MQVSAWVFTEVSRKDKDLSSGPLKAAPFAKSRLSGMKFPLGHMFRRACGPTDPVDLQSTKRQPVPNIPFVFHKNLYNYSTCIVLLFPQILPEPSHSPKVEIANRIANPGKPRCPDALRNIWTSKTNLCAHYAPTICPVCAHHTPTQIPLGLFPAYTFSPLLCRWKLPPKNICLHTFQIFTQYCRSIATGNIEG